MQDREIVRMAAFKLQECARRLMNLANGCDAESTHVHLRGLATELFKQEEQLRASLASGDDAAADSTGPSGEIPV